jgi:hypothetical protein
MKNPQQNSQASRDYGCRSPWGMTHDGSFQMDNPIYLGDGVYAKFEHSELMLWTDRQENGRNWLVLGPRELESLLHWLSRQSAPITDEMINNRLSKS